MVEMFTKKIFYMYIPVNRYWFVFLSVGLYSEHKDKNQFAVNSFSAVCRSPDSEREYFIF